MLVIISPSNLAYIKTISSIVDASLFSYYFTVQQCFDILKRAGLVRVEFVEEFKALIFQVQDAL